MATLYYGTKFPLQWEFTVYDTSISINGRRGRTISSTQNGPYYNILFRIIPCSSHGKVFMPKSNSLWPFDKIRIYKLILRSLPAEGKWPLTSATLFKLSSAPVNVSWNRTEEHNYMKTCIVGTCSETFRTPLVVRRLHRLNICNKMQSSWSVIIWE